MSSKRTVCVACVHPFQEYSREIITAGLEAGGFRVEGVWNDLAGTPYAEGGEWIGVVAQKI